MYILFAQIQVLIVFICLRRAKVILTPQLLRYSCFFVFFFENPKGLIRLLQFTNWYILNIIN